MSALVEVDAPDGCDAVEVMKDDSFLEDVVVAVVFCEGRFGPGNFHEVAEFREEKSIVGAFGSGWTVASAQLNSGWKKALTDVLINAIVFSNLFG